MALRVVVLLIVCALCTCNEGVEKKVQPCGIGQKDCVPEGDDTPSASTTQDFLFLYLPSPMSTFLVGLVVFAGYMTRTLPSSLCPPWLPYRQRSRRYVVQHTRGELHDLATMRNRLNDVERERDELRMQLDNKRLREKPSELDLARQWVNPPQTRAEPTCQWAGLALASPPKHSESTGSLDMRRHRDDDRKEDDRLCVNVWKAPSMPTRGHAGTMTCIPMPCKTTAQRAVVNGADYARKCREALTKLAESEKKIARLTKETEVMQTLRDELDVVIDQRNMLGRRITGLNRDKKEMMKQIGTLQDDVKTGREQYVDVKKQHQALTRQFEQMKNNAKALARDKRLLGRQLLEAREELDMVRAKLDGIHREKSQLIETLERLTMQERLDEARSAQVQNEQSLNFSRRKSSSTQPMPFRNRFSFGKQRNMPSEQVTEQHKSAYAVVQMSSRNKTSQRGVQISTLRSTTGAISKVPKTLEDKSEDLVRHRQYTQETKFKRMSSRSLSTPPLRIEKKDQPKKDQQKGQKAIDDSKREQEDSEKKKYVAEKAVKKPTRQRVKSPREMGTKSSVDITEFAKSLQRLERNVEINMRVRETTAFHVQDRKPEDEKMRVTEIYHNSNRKETDEWESSTVISLHSTSSTSISDKTKPVDSVATIELLDSDSQIELKVDEEVSENDLKMELDASSCSLCCLDSRCSMCTTADCPLEHRSCSDINCTAVCSSCSSLPLERSQSIVSEDESFDNVDVETSAAATAGLAAIFGNGPIGEGGPWNLPGLSGIPAHITRPATSVLACQGSLGEVTVGVNTMSNEEVAHRDSAPAEEEEEEESGNEGAAKKLISRFTAANRTEERSRRVGPPSPTLMKFLEELTSLAMKDRRGKESQSEVTNTQKEVTKDFKPSLLADLIHAVNSSPSEECTYGSAGSDDSGPSSGSTEYYVNDDREPLF